jgi:hypothetical protein
MLRYSSSYLWLAVFLGLLCYLTFIDKKMPGTEDQEKAENQLFNLEPMDVTSLEIRNVHGLFIIKKDNNHWEIEKPVVTLADSATVEGILAQIAAATPQRIIKIDGSDKDADNLKEWGLLPTPAERVVIHTKDKQYILLVGRKTAISDSVYARASERKSEPVRVIPFTVKQELQKDLSDLRSRNVFDFEPDKVTKIATHLADTATTPGQQCEIEQKDGHWTLQMPLVARASDQDVFNLINKILSERIVDFVTDDASNLSEYGLTSPSATLSVSITPDEDLVLQIGGPVPNKPDQVYAQRLKSNSVFTLTRASVDEILKAVPNVRDRHVMAFDPGKATGLTVSVGSHKVQVEKKDDLWSTVGDSAGRADVAKVTDMLAKLSQLETTPVLKDSATDLKPFGLDKPIGKIVVTSPEFKPGPSLTLFIGKTENNLTYVRNSAEPFIYTIPSNALDFLSANNLETRDTRVISLEYTKVRQMTITADSKPPIVLNRSEGGTWSLANMKDRMVDSTRANTQGALFCQLVAKSWLGPVQPSFGLSKPVLTISVQAEKPNPVVLHIGAALPDGGRAAILEGENTAFEIAEGDFSLLNASSLAPIPSVINAAVLNTALSGTNSPTDTVPSTNAAPAK